MGVKGPTFTHTSKGGNSWGLYRGSLIDTWPDGLVQDYWKQTLKGSYLGGGNSNIVLCSSLFGKDSHFGSYFSKGLKPPTTYSLFSFVEWGFIEIWERCRTLQGSCSLCVRRFSPNISGFSGLNDVIHLFFVMVKGHIQRKL